MRERLIELLEQCSCHRSPPCTGECHECHNVEMFDKEIEHIADHLLANGVIVLKAGHRFGLGKAKVYCPVKGTSVVLETLVYGVGVDDDGNAVINPKEYPDGVFSILGYELDKTVFLTREQAEKALRERSYGDAK